MTKRLISMVALAALMALSLLAFAGFASAKPKGHVVRPGQSIQKAIEAAHPGDTIAVLGGVHRESVRVKKDGVSLRGVDAVLKPPAKQTSSPLGKKVPAGYRAFAFKQTTCP